MQRFIFCPGAIYGAKGWTPIVRVSRDGKPCGSKTTEPFKSREDAEAHATRAAHRAAKAIGATFSGRAEFVVRDPVGDAGRAIAEALAAAPPAPSHNFVRDIIARVVGVMFPGNRAAA